MKVFWKRITALLMAMLCGSAFVGCDTSTENGDNGNNTNDTSVVEKLSYAKTGYLQSTTVKQAVGKTNVETGEKEEAELVSTKVVNNVRFLQYSIGEIQNCFLQTVTQPIHNDGIGLKSLTYEKGTVTSRGLSNAVGKSISESNTIEVSEGSSVTYTWDLNANAHASKEDSINMNVNMLSADSTMSKSFDLAASYNKVERSYSSQEISQGVAEASYENMDISTMEESWEATTYEFDMTKYEEGYYYALCLVADIEVYQVVAYNIVSLEFYTSYFATNISGNNTALRMMSAPDASFTILPDYQLSPIEGISVDTSDDGLERAYAVTLDSDGGSDGGVYYVENMDTLILPKPTKDGFYFLGWFDENGEKSLEEIKPVKDMTLTAHWSPLTKYEDINFERQNCKVDAGYDPEQVGGSIAEKTHSTFELISLEMEQCFEIDKDAGIYGIGSNETFKISIKMWETNRGAGPDLGWDNWYTHRISNDTYDDRVYGTDINGERVGRGAYYVKITYTDGRVVEKSKTDIFNEVSKGEVVDIPLEPKEGGKIDTIEIVVVYELYYEYYVPIKWPNGETNWRCSKTLKIVY